MPLGTNMPGFPEIGVVERVTPSTGYSPIFPGATIVYPYLRRPRSSDFTATGVLTWADNIDRLTVNVTSAATNLRLLMQPVVQVPYTIDMACTAGVSGVTGGNIVSGIGLFDGTKIRGFYAGLSANTTVMIVTSWNTTTGAVANPRNIINIAYGIWFLRITDDGTTRNYNYSWNGKDYANFFSENTNTFVTPTQMGMIFLNDGGQVAKTTVYHFQVSSGILGDAP